jgi:hypothetical protein
MEDKHNLVDLIGSKEKSLKALIAVVNPIEIKKCRRDYIFGVENYASRNPIAIKTNILI